MRERVEWQLLKFKIPLFIVKKSIQIYLTIPSYQCDQMRFLLSSSRAIAARCKCAEMLLIAISCLVRVIGPQIKLVSLEFAKLAIIEPKLLS